MVSVPTRMVKRLMTPVMLTRPTFCLKAASERTLPVISSYLTRMFPCTAPHLRYKDAVSAVMENIKKERLREQMLFLLRKTSDGAGLDTAAQKWAKIYDIVDARKFHSLMKQFDKLHVNPITLTSNDKTEIPCLCTLIQLE